MGNSGDIYSKEKQKTHSPWKSGHHHRKPIVDPENSRERESKKDDDRIRALPRSPARRRKLKIRRNRRIMIALGLVVLLGYIGYTGIVALKGLMAYKGIDYENLSFIKIFSKKSPSATPNLTVAEASALGTNKFNAVAIIDRIDKSKSIEMDVRNMLDKGLVAQAIERVQDAQGALWESVKLKEMLADAYMQEKRYAEALNVLTANLALDPSDNKARLQMAEALLNLGDYKNAISIAEWALRGDANKQQSCRIMAESYAGMGMITESISEYRKIIALNPENDEARSKLAMAYYKGREYGRAVTLLNELIEKGTDNSLAYYNLAICYAKQSLVDETVRTLMQAERKFGKKFVRTWVLGNEFDSMRNKAKFILFANELDLKPGVAGMRTPDRKTQKNIDLGRSPLQLNDGAGNLLNRDR